MPLHVLGRCLLDDRALTRKGLTKYIPTWTIDGLISQRVRSSSTQGLVVLGKHIKRASNSAKCFPVASATYNTFTNGFLQHHHRPHLYPHQRGDPRRLRRPGILRRITRPSVHPHRPGNSRRIWWPGLLCHRLSTLCSRLTWPTLTFVHLCMYHALNGSVLQLLTLNHGF